MIREGTFHHRGDGKEKQLPERLLTVVEVAELLHVHPNTVRRWSDLGLIKSYRVGPRGDRRFDAGELDGFIANARPTERGAVLIVDDDPAVRQLLEDAVVRQGYEVISVESGERALKELEQQHFDLVFLDLVLPRLSGVNVLRAIKKSSKGTVVAVITGYGDDPIALEAMSLGPMFLIRKPFKMPEVIEVVDAIMRVRH